MSAAWERLFGHGALIHRMAVHRQPADGLSLVSVLAETRLSKGRRVTGCGAAESLESARVKAVGELVERYCLQNPPPHLALSRASQLRGKRLCAGDLPSFTAEQLATPQFPLVALDEERPRPWVQAESLLTRERVWVPARLVWLSVPEPGPRPFCYPTSTGAACHIHLEDALLSGLLEVVERDALTLVWESRAITPLLDPGAAWMHAEVGRLWAQLRRLGLELLLRDISTDTGLPTVLAVIRDQQGRRPALAIGSATRLCVSLACRDAVFEACQSWNWMREEHGQRGLSLQEAWDAAARPIEMRDHAYLYGFEEMAIHAAHLLERHVLANLDGRPVHRRAGDACSALEQAVAKLAAVGFEPLWVDITTPELRALGFFVIRILVAGLVPMSVGRWCRHLANPRIREVPERLGWKHAGPLPVLEGQPHPLP